ncbi:hypothetical protein VN97_g1241 [Penicillium thymicola]|uniref:Uncharacterized protein n=1 Tax=Penicillium thymicola TaxID=293382 RepID=A0AAI9TRD7_PENTH|nr:hypothetical protein VN97_g1241 [Penicillium thymicola]
MIPRSSTPATHEHHPGTHLATNDRDTPSDSPSADMEPPQQSPSVASPPMADRKRKHATTTDDVRQMFGSFSTELDEDCGYVDAIANKRATIKHMTAELNPPHPEAQRILRLNEEIINHYGRLNMPPTHITLSLVHIANSHFTKTDIISKLNLKKISRSLGRYLGVGESL